MIKKDTDTAQKKEKAQKTTAKKTARKKENSTGAETKESDTDGEEQNKIEETLRLFREKVTTLGYIGIENTMIPVVMQHGTTRDKVALMVNAHFDMLRFGEAPKISLKQVEEIRAEVKTHGRKEMVEYMNCLSVYDSLQLITNHLLRYKFSFLATAYQSTIYFQTYEWLGKAEELFNKFAPLVDPNKQEEFKQVAETYNNYLQHFQTFGELEEISGEEGWIDKQRESCLAYAEGLSTGKTPFSCVYRLSQLKGVIDAIEQWINDNNAHLFVSLFLRRQVVALRTSTIFELQDKYYYSHLKAMEERGETPTDEDRRIAIFPEYEDVERSNETYENITNKLNEYRKVYN